MANALNKEQIELRLAKNGKLIEACFNNFMEAFSEDEIEQVKPLTEAFAYTFKAGGKRIRPSLTIEACKAAGQDEARAVPFATAVEMIHTYSLIHDDLPVMDNDKMRRGKPSNHVVFGEANALLAGDALLTEAFSVMQEALSRGVDAKNVIIATRLLASYAGIAGMVGGQVMDLRSEKEDVDFDTLVTIQARKTGCLIEGSVALGLLAAGFTPGNALYDSFICYAQKIGLAFQIMDDILDVVGDPKLTGKTGGKDRKAHKKTFMRFFQPDEARVLVRELTDQAVKEVAPYDKGGFFVGLARYLAQRQS